MGFHCTANILVVGITVSSPRMVFRKVLGLCLNLCLFLNPNYFKIFASSLISCSTSTNQQSADQGLMIRSLVPEDPMGETDCSTFVLFQDNK